jgi:hypothetical protein
MQTPIQANRLNYTLNFDPPGNDDTNYQECRDYIDNFINDGADEEKQFMNYQHQNKLASPFVFSHTNMQRQPLSSIQCEQDLETSKNINPRVPPFELKPKSSYTHCVKDNKKDFSFVYDKASNQHKDHMLFNAFNDVESYSSTNSIVSIFR